MFKRKIRSSHGRRLADVARPAGGGVPFDVLYIVFALGLLAGIWFARSQSD